MENRQAKTTPTPSPSFSGASGHLQRTHAASLVKIAHNIGFGGLVVRDARKRATDMTSENPMLIFSVSFMFKNWVQPGHRHDGAVTEAKRLTVQFKKCAMLTGGVLAERSQTALKKGLGPAAPSPWTAETRSLGQNGRAEMATKRISHHPSTGLGPNAMVEQPLNA